MGKEIMENEIKNPVELVKTLCNLPSNTPDEVIEDLCGHLNEHSRQKSFYKGYNTRVQLQYFLQDPTLFEKDFNYKEWLNGWKQAEQHISKGYCEYYKLGINYVLNDHLQQYINCMPEVPPVLSIVSLRGDSDVSQDFLNEFEQYSSDKWSQESGKSIIGNFKWHIFGFKTINTDFETQVKAMGINNTFLDYHRFINRQPDYYFSGWKIS